MPLYRQSTISHESLEALLDALGFEDMHNPHEVLKAPNYTDVSHEDCKSTLTVGSYGAICDPLSPISSVEEAMELSQTYMSDYDFGSDFDEEGSDCDYDDTLPSRPSSIFEMVQVDAAAPVVHRPGRLAPSPRSSLSSIQTATSRSPDHFPWQNQAPPQHRYCLYDISSPTPSTLSFQSHSTSCSTDSSCLSPAETLTIKAALNASIIMLRVPRAISFEDLKQRLHKKFVTQEGILLKPSFSVVNVIAPTQHQPTSTLGSSIRPGVSRTRSESMTFRSPIASPSIGANSPQASRRVSFAERTEMRFVDTEAEWRTVVSMHIQGTKVALRILDTSP
ncbi:hypothetical protein CPB83DRAFT_897541 [Crepidotus variabilis]|uniref:Uncharacterized protein n=1 Tax=Crepidotus variabilis TaxID=179855 RepID=A0A9P6E9N8_9AGAR|nr:hypothetical protein CPB83DRAFT_897541 [Crepidotus variabilis]